jgi:dipeptidase
VSSAEKFDKEMSMIVKKRFARMLPVAALFVLCFMLLISAAPCEGCFAVVVGKEASVDGYVIIAHNEDDDPPQIVNHYKVPRKKHTPSEKVRLRNGGEVNQVEETWSYIWSEMPGMLFSDGYVNEWGVSIISNKCPSREDKPEITDGGIGYMLRRLVAERAKTARAGVLLTGRLVERFGYIDSGRTYIICDPDEGWFFSVVNGKHWLAKRVPDNQVAMIANSYTIRQVDLSDRDNFLASDDIIEYAISRDWHKPEKDGPFDFAAAYANPDAASSLHNFGRRWAGLRYITDELVPLGPDLPFSIVPRCKVGVTDIMQIMRDHYEGTKLQSSSPTGSPHESGRPICVDRTRTSFVIQLRKNMPLDIGIVYWTCLASPCSSIYIPFHFGIADFPAGYSSQVPSKSQRPSRNLYEAKISSPFRADPFEAFWTFSNFGRKVHSAYRSRIVKVKALCRKVEKNALALQNPLEEAAYRLYKKDKTTAMQMLGNYCNGIYMSSMEAMDRVLSKK